MQTDDETKKCGYCDETFTFNVYSPYRYCPYCGGVLGKPIVLKREITRK